MYRLICESCKVFIKFLNSIMINSLEEISLNVQMVLERFVYQNFTDI
jgi:hypothetical protein